jgi:hypothetical protein
MNEHVDLFFHGRPHGAGRAREEFRALCQDEAEKRETLGDLYCGYERHTEKRYR